MSRPMQWVIDTVLVPLMGEEWPGEPIAREWNTGLIGNLNELSRIVDTMAGDAQASSLSDLKRARRHLRAAVKYFSDAVDNAESRAKRYREHKKRPGR